MCAEHRFKDEWIVRAVLTLPGITSDQINDFRRLAKPFLSQSLIQVGLASVSQLGEAVQKLYKIPLAKTVSRDVDKMAVSMLPERICQKLMVFPIQIKGEYIEVAMANPLDMDAQRDIQVLSGRTVLPYFCLPDTIQLLIAEFYSGDNVLKEILSRLDVQEDVEYLGAESDDLNINANEQIYQPVVKLANSLIAKAVTLGASDIHIEHDEKNSYVRYRIDGILRRVMNLPKSLAGGPLISRIKIMANLDVADHNRPQDGGAKVLVSGKEISLRVSTLPTNYGEKAVIRILDPAATTIPFEQMGFPETVIARLNALITAAQGIILVTGPTGSGKTTTLYTALSKLKSEDTNIVTVEDPIEYKLPGINQVQVNEKAGLTFSSVLRSVLRQDPDVILIGEIRDTETAHIAFQAAITGHIVFSTLHTNDSISAVSRLHDMGVERFKLAPGLLAITAQRLVRRLCKACRTPAAQEDFDPLAERLLARHKLPKTYWKPVGCDQCNFLGYKGRLALIELLELNTRLRERVAAGDSEENLRQTALADKMLYPIVMDTLWHLSQGDTSLEEVLPYLSMEGSQKPSGAEAPNKPPDPIKPTPGSPPLPSPSRPSDPFEGYGEIALPETTNERGAQGTNRDPGAHAMEDFPEAGRHRDISPGEAGPSAPDLKPSAPAEFVPVEIEPLLPDAGPLRPPREAVPAATEKPKDVPPPEIPAHPLSQSQPEPMAPAEAPSEPLDTTLESELLAGELEAASHFAPVSLPESAAPASLDPLEAAELEILEAAQETPPSAEPAPETAEVEQVPSGTAPGAPPASPNEGQRPTREEPAPPPKPAEPSESTATIEISHSLEPVPETAGTEQGPSGTAPEPPQTFPKEEQAPAEEKSVPPPKSAATPPPTEKKAPPPAAPEAAPASVKGSDSLEPPEKEIPSKKGDVMIVDDNAALRLLLRCILEDAGFNVIEGKDGAHAMEILLNMTPDVMLLDLNVSKLSGEELIKRVHQSMNLFPIIVLTSNSDDKSQVDTLSIGADDYIIKPFIPSIVLARVRAAMRRTGK